MSLKSKATAFFVIGGWSLLTCGLLGPSIHDLDRNTGGHARSLAVEFEKSVVPADSRFAQHPGFTMNLALLLSLGTLGGTMGARVLRQSREEQPGPRI